MAETNYSEDGIDSAALNDLVQAGVLNQFFLTALDKEKGDPVTGVWDDLGDIEPGTDVGVINSGGTISLSELDGKTIKDLNALIFSTEDDVNLTLDKRFKGLVSFGGGDDTTVYSGANKQNISAGAGNDSVTTGSGKDFVNAGEGDDSVSTGAGNDSVKTGAGNDTVVTGGGSDTVVTGNGSDSVNAGGGKDKIIVDTDDAVGENTVTIDGGKGVDTLLLTEVDVVGGSVDGTTVHLHLSDGTMLDISNVEKFVLDTDGDYTPETIGITGLSTYLDGLN